MRTLRTLALAITALTALSQTSAAQAPGECSRWTGWNAVHPLPVLFSWRLCDAPAGRYDIQWRFANQGTEQIEFKFELYTGMGVRCGEDNRGERFTSGTQRLKPGQRDDHYSGRKRIRRTGFQSGFTLYVCVITEA